MIRIREGPFVEKWKAYFDGNSTHLEHHAELGLWIYHMIFPNYQMEDLLRGQVMQQ